MKPTEEDGYEECGKPTYKDGKHTGYCVLWEGHEDEGLMRDCSPCIVLQPKEAS